MHKIKLWPLFSAFLKETRCKTMLCCWKSPERPELYLYKRAVGGVYINLPPAPSPSFSPIHCQFRMSKKLSSRSSWRLSLPSSGKQRTSTYGPLASFAAIKTGVPEYDESEEAVQKCYAMNSWPELRSWGLQIRLPSRHMSALGVLKDYTDVLMLASFCDSFAVGV